MSKRGVETYQARRRAEGWVKATVWLSPETQRDLNQATAICGADNSRDAVIAKALSFFADRA